MNTKTSKSYGKIFISLLTLFQFSIVSIILPVSFSFVSPQSVSAQSLETTHVSRLNIPVSSGVLVVEKTGDQIHKRVLVSDYLSSTKSIIDENGSVSTYPSYYPYGSSTTNLNLDPTNKYYTGQRKVTDESDLYNYNARYYNPDTGVFIQPDTEEGPNRYAYVDGNPIMKNDPSGHRPADEERGSNQLQLQIMKQSIVYQDGGIRSGIPLANARYEPTEGITYEALAKTSTIVGVVAAAPFVGLAEGRIILQSLGTSALRSLTSEVAKKIAKTALRNFAGGAATSGIFEAAVRKSMHEDATVNEVLKYSVYGGFSQAISFGLLGPNEAIVSKLGLGSIAKWVPALAVDSAIWSPQSITTESPQIQDYVSAYGFQIGVQSFLQSAIIGVDKVGEHKLANFAHFRNALGSKVLFSILGLMLVKNWVSTK